jgi:hypothetical protein
MITVAADEIRVETRTLSAVVRRGWLTSLVSKATGEQLIRPFDPGEEAALQLVYRGGEAVRVDGHQVGGVEARPISDHRAEVRCHDWDADGVIEVGEDEQTGDLLLGPAAYSGRAGVLACRWTLKGMADGLELVAPLWQGVRLPVDDPINRNARRRWPREWEAGLAILQGREGGFWVHCRDTRYLYKALRFGASSDARALSFETEAYGPIDANRAAGGLTWRINVHQGGWEGPASAYRDWLYGAYGLKEAAAGRQEWLRGLKMALSWCPCDLELLDAIARRVEPGRVLLHFPHWRTDGYDENYPTYKASEAGTAFIAKAHAMGYHVAPHFNAFEIDPSHPLFPLVRDFVFRHAETNRLDGWSWHKGQAMGPPESNLALAGNRARKVMVKIHPGLSMWRSLLGEAILSAALEHALKAVFIDVTLNTNNLSTGFVEGMTATEGALRLIRQVAGLGGGLVVGGEGLNEITAQALSFAQAHLYGYGGYAEGVERTGGCALNSLLFGDLCRTIGYSSLSGKTEAEVLRMRLHEEHGAIPTITVRSAEAVDKPNAAVERVLKMAGG